MAKRGRKVGGVSFCKVSLAELNRILKPEASVIVSLKFAGLLGLNGSRIESDESTMKAVAASKDADIKLESFEDEDCGLRPTITLESFDEFP